METLRTSEVFSDTKIKLIAVESVKTRYNRSNSGCHFYADIQPIALVVCGTDGAYALDMESMPADVDLLKQNVPELSVIVGRYRRNE